MSPSGIQRMSLEISPVVQAGLSFMHIHREMQGMWLIVPRLDSEGQPLQVVERVFVQSSHARWRTLPPSEQ
jgi:hypothetical protein